jgi:hypothetical protein
MRSDDVLSETSGDATSVRDALLRRAYEGEIIGCAMYDRMISDPAYPKKDALHLLYVVERITADALEPRRNAVRTAVEAHVGGGHSAR